jgi:hypothetical protein
MSGVWRGQGGRRAKGRRGEQDPELDNTAWLAELEQKATQADAGDEEEDWASTLRGRRSPDPPPPPPAPPPARPPPPEPDWMQPADPAPSPPDYRSLGREPEGTGSSSWDAGPTPQDPPFTPPPAPDPDWSTWRPPDREGFGEGAPPAPMGRDLYGEPQDGRAEADWRSSRADPGTGGWESAGVETPTGAWSQAEPAERDPDYPALFGELYRRNAAQLDPIWEAPPAAEPLPDPGQPDPPPSAWPFEETTQSWEPSDRSFVWPADELPATPAPTPWEPPAAPSWLDEPAPEPPPPDQTSAWPDPGPAPQTSAWSPAPANVDPPPPATSAPPPADWAAAIPTDVPAARRVSDPSAAARAWHPDEALDAEPAVPLGAAAWPAPGGAAQAPSDSVGARRTAPYQDRRARRPDERSARAWPRIVAIISWIVLVMVVCWFYVFPWLERILPESF